MRTTKISVWQASTRRSLAAAMRAGNEPLLIIDGYDHNWRALHVGVPFVRRTYRTLRKAGIDQHAARQIIIGLIDYGYVAARLDFAVGLTTKTAPVPKVTA